MYVMRGPSSRGYFVRISSALAGAMNAAGVPQQLGQRSPCQALNPGVRSLMRSIALQPLGVVDELARGARWRAREREWAESHAIA